MVRAVACWLLVKIALSLLDSAKFLVIVAYRLSSIAATPTPIDVDAPAELAVPLCPAIDSEEMQALRSGEGVTIH